MGYEINTISECTPEGRRYVPGFHVSLRRATFISISQANILYATFKCIGYQGQLYLSTGLIPFEEVSEDRLFPVEE